MILQGDCLEKLQSMDAESVDSLVCDPPAGISFMGKSWDSDRGGGAAWIAWLASVMKEVHRVLKPGAHGLVWAIPRTSHWTATALENAGFEVRDVVTHIFGTGFPKSLDISKAIDKAAGVEREKGEPKPYTNQDIRNNNYDRQDGVNERIQSYTTLPATDSAKQWSGWGTSLKPSNERWVLVRKPLNTVPTDDILREINQEIGEILCLLPLPARFAEIISRSSRSVSSEAQFDSVLWPADVLTTVANVGLSAMMDMFRSPEAAKIFLNTVSLWSAILAENSPSVSTSITSTETSPIIELKTLRSWILQTIQESITQGETDQSGVSSNAITAAKIFSESLERLRSILIRFAPENVLKTVTTFETSIAQSLPVESAIKGGISSEDIILIRKPCSEKTVAANVLKHGTGGLNIDGCRVTADWDNDPNRRGFQGGSNGTSIFSGDRTGVEGEKPQPNPQGRFPSNLVLSHNADCDDKCTEGCAVAELDRQSGVSDARGGKSKGRKANDARFAKNSFGDNGATYNDTGGASRFFYCAKASKADRNAGLDGIELIEISSPEWEKQDQKVVLQVDTEPLAPKVIGVYGASTLSACEWSMLLFGSQSTDQSQEGCRSTISITIPSTIESKTCNWLRRLNTSEFTRDANYETGSGGSLADLAENSSESKPATTSDQTVIVTSVRNALLPALLEIKSAKPLSNGHPTIKSTKLMEYLIRLVTPPGGIVLDPFMGSGSTGVAAKRLGFRFLGIELDPEYIEIAKRRIENA